MATAEADIPEPVSITKKVGENICLTRGQSDGLVDETSPDELKKLQGLIHLLPETAEHLAEKENMQVAVGPETMNIVIEGNVETAEGQRFFESPSAVEVASKETCKVSKHCQDEVVPNQGDKEMSDNEKQMNNKKIEVADESGNGGNEVMEESEEKPEKNDKSHDIVNITESSLQTAEIEESNLIGEEILMEERSTDQDSKVITDQGVSVEDKSIEKETGDMHKNEKDGTQTDRNTNLEFNKEVLGILEAKLDQNEEASIHIWDPTVISLNKDVETSIEKESGEKSSKEVENKAERSTNLVGEEKSPEAIEPSERVGNGKEESEISMHDGTVDSFPAIAVHPDIQSDEEATLKITEGVEEILYKPSITLATDASSIHEAGPEAEEILKEVSSISCKEEFQEKIEPSENMNYMTQVEDEMNQKNSLDTFATKTEETCLQKVDNPELFKVTHEILTDDSVKEGPKELQEQIDLIEKTVEDDSLSSEKNKNFENTEQKGDGSFTKHEGTLSANEGVATTDESSGENRYEEGSTVIVTKDNTDHTEIINALEHSQSGTSDREERPDNLLQNEPEKEKLERSLSVADDDFIEAASTDHAETISCVKEEAPIKIHKERFEEKNTAAMEHSQSGTSDYEERSENLQQNEPEKEKLEGSLSVVAVDSSIVASTESDETTACAHGETPFKSQEESFEEIMKEDLAIHIELPEDKNEPQIELNEKIEGVEVEVPNKNANDLHDTDPLIEVATQTEGKSLDSISNFEPEGQGQEAYEASTEKDKHTEDAPDEYQSGNCTILEHPSIEGGVTTEVIPKTSETSVIKDSGENTDKEMENNEEACGTFTDKLLSKSDDAGKSTIDAETSLEANSAVFMRDEKAEQKLQVESPLEAAPASRGEDESYKAEDNDKRSNVTYEEVHDGTKITGSEVSINEQVIIGTVTHFSPESIEQETVEISVATENKVEKSEEENSIEQAVDESNITGLILESVEQVPVKNLQDEKEKAEEATGEIHENAKKEGAAEIIKHETSKTIESPQEILDTCQVKGGESLQRKGLPVPESSLDEKPEKNEPGEKPEQPLHLMSEKKETFSSDADKIPCQMEEAVPQTLEEAPQKEETEKEIEENNDTKDSKIGTEEDHHAVVETSDASKSTESIVLEPKTEMDNNVAEDDIKTEDSKELLENCKDSGKDEEAENQDIMQEYVATNIFQEPFDEKIVQSSEEDKKEEEACAQFEATSVETRKEVNIDDHSREIEVEEIEESSKEDHTVTYISSESTERETIEIYPVDATKEETSGGEHNLKQIVEESNTRDLIQESVDEVPVKNLEDEEKKAKESRGEIFEKSKMEETAESIVNETYKTTESPREILDTFQVKQGESLHTEEENVTVTESSPEEKPEKNEPPEQLEKPLSLISDENEAFISDSDTMPHRMEEGTSQNLEEAAQKEENEKETELNSEIKDNKITMEEDHQLVAEISDTSKSTESTILETITEMNNMVVEDDRKKEESKELCEDCKDAGEFEETKQHDRTEECVTTPELIEENIVQSSEDDKKEEQTPKIEACAQLEATSVGEDAEKQTQNEENIVDQSRELEINETEQRPKEDHTVPYISLESIEQETANIYPGDAHEAEKSEGENKIKQIVEESDIRDFIPESVEQVSVKNLKDDEMKAEESTGEIFEKSKTEETGESIANETWEPTESPKEILDTFQVKQGESLQREEKNVTAKESFSEEKPQKNEAVEELEKPLSLMSDKNEAFGSDADKLRCLMEEEASQNHEEGPQQVENDKETEDNNDTKDNKIAMEKDLQVVVKTSDTSKSPETIVLESKSEMDKMVDKVDTRKVESEELCEDKDVGKVEEIEKHDTVEECVTVQEHIGETIVQSSEENKKLEEAARIEACAQFEATSVETRKVENIVDHSREIEVEEIEESTKEDHTVTYISSESTEQETIEIYPVDANKEETSGGEHNLKQIVEESNTRDLITESVDQVPVKNLEDDEKKAKESTGEIFEKSKMEETAESIVNQTCKTTEIPREILDTFQVKQGESLQTEEENVTVTASSPEEKPEKNEPPEQLEKPLSLMSEENEAFISDSDTMPRRMEEGTPQNLEEAAQKEENEKETELNSEIKDNKITMDEDHQVVAEMSDTRKRADSTVLETMTEMNNVVVEDDIKKEESKELCEDCKDAGEVEETKQHDTTEECVTTPELIEENIVQSSEDDKKEEQTPKIEACAQLEATSVGEDAEKPTQNEGNIVAQSRELEIDETEQMSKEGHTVPYISLESIEQETANIYPGDANEAEKSEGENKIKQIVEESDIRDLIPESVEQVSVKNLEDEEMKAEESTGEIFEKSKTEETGESIANETWKTTESPKEILDTFQVKQGESFQSEEKNVTATESSSEEKPQKNEAVEELEKPESLMSDKNEAFGSDADKMRCLMEEGASQNLEEAPQQEENDKETEDNNDTKDNKIAMEKDLQVVVEISDTSKSTETIVLESKSEMDKMVDKVDTRKEESKELCEDKDVGKVEEIEKHDTVEECVTVHEHIGEKIVQSSEENKKLEEAARIEACAQFEETSVETRKEENIDDHSREIEVEEIEESSKEDHTVTYISSESTERETIEIYPVDANKEETSGGEHNLKQIVEESNTRDLIQESVDEVPVKNLEDEEKKAKESRGEIFEKSKMEETAESIVNETYKTTESPREILDTFQVKQGESLHTEEENVTVTESSPEEKPEKNEPPEQLEKPLSLMPDENESFISDSDKIPCRMEEGTPQNLEETPHKEENEKETEYRSEINDSKIVIEEDHQVVAEMSDTRKSADSTVLETMTEMNNVVVEDDIKKEESKELCEDCKDAGDVVETEQHDTTKECVTIPELIGENIVQSSEDDKKVEETPKIEACAQLDTTTACEDVAKQTLIEEHTIDQSKEEEVEETEQSFKVDHRVANISLESVEQEAVEISSENKIKAEESVEQVSVKNLEDEETQAKESTGEILDNSNTEEAAESTAHETSKTMESPREILDTFQVKYGEILQGEEMNISATASSQNLEEAPQREENEKEIEENNDTKENKITMEEDLQAVAETSDASKSTESTVLEPETEMDNMVIEDDIKKKEPKELYENSKDAGKDADIEKHDIMEECVNTNILVETTEEKLLQSPEDYKKEEETSNIELEANSVGEDAEKQTLKEENMVDQSRDLEVEKIEQSSNKDHTVTYISSETIEQETVEISPGNENNAEEISEGQNKIEKIAEESNTRGIVLESVEQVPVKNLEDEERKAEESTGETFENSKTKEEAESFAHETSKNMESPEEILNTFQVKHEESLQTEQGNLTATESSTEEKRNVEISPVIVAEGKRNDSEEDLQHFPQKNEVGEKLEQPISLISDKNEAFSSDADKIPCLMEERTRQNLEEAPQKEENEKETEDSSDTKGNKMATAEDPQVVAETCDASKSTESIFLELKTEMDNMVTEDDIRKEDSKELYEDHKDARKDEETEKHNITEECGTTDILPEPIGEKILQSSQEDEKKEETPRIEACAQHEIAGVGEDAEKQTLNEENIVDWSRELEVQRIEQSSEVEDMAAKMSKQEGCEITQSVDEDVYAGKQKKEGGAAENKFEAYETADSITSREKQGTEEDTKQGLLSSSVEKESSQEDESKGEKLKEEVDKLNSPFMENIEVTSSIEETDSVTLKDSAESNINYNPLDVRKASEEAPSEEINECLVETSTLVSEVSDKDNKEGITAKQETTIDDSDSVSVMVVTEEICLQEAETKDKKQVESLAPAFEENGILGTEAKETISENVDVNVKPEDIPNLGEKRDKEIPTEKTDCKMENEAPHERSDDQNEVIANEMPLEEISEEMVSSTETSKEHELMNSEESEQIGEPTEKSQAPYENIETPFVAQEIDLMQKQDETTNPSNVDTEKETAYDEVQKQRVEDLYEHSELDKEKSLYISEDIETSEREETRELPESDKNQIEEDCSDKQIQEDEKEMKEKEEPKLEAEDQKEQNATETIKAVILTGKAHEGVKQSEDTEDINEQLVEEECGINELNALSTVVETTDEVKESSLVYSKYTMAADSKEKTETETENSEVEEDSTRGREAPFARQSDEQKVQDSIIEPPEKIEEITEISQDSNNKIDNVAPTTETSPGEAEIGDKLVKAFHIDQGEPCLETSEIKYSQQGKDVDSEIIEETSGDLASKLQTKDSGHAESMTITVENTARGEPEEIESACEADYESKGQSEEETDFGKCLTEEKLDQVPTNEHDHAQRNNVAMESSYPDEVEETRIAPRAVDETQGPDAERTAETGRSPNVVKIDQILSGNSEHAQEDSFVLENPNADEDNEVKIICDAIHESKGQGTEESARKSPGVEKLDQDPVTNSEDAEKESLSEENKDSDEVVETKIASNVVYRSKEQGTEDSDETGKSPTAEQADADKSEEACKETSGYRAQGVEPVIDDEMTTEQTPLVEKLEEQLLTLTSALPFKNGTTTTVDNTEEEKTEKMDEGPEDSSATKPTEEISRQEDVPRELQVSTLGLTTNKDAKGSLTEVHKEEGQTSDGTIQVEHPENQNNIKCVDSSSESNKIIDLTRPTEKAGNLEFETSEKALESELVILRHEVLPEAEDTEIKEKHVAVINDTRAEENQSKKSSEANEITQKEVLKEEISEEKEVAKTYQPNSLCEEKTNKSLQEGEIKPQECTGEKPSRTFEATVSGIQDEKLSAETEKAIATETIEKQVTAEDRSIEDQDQVSVENKIIKESFQIESEGKDVEDSAIKLDSRNQAEENNFGSGKTEATTIMDEESGIEVSQKESIEEFEKGIEFIQETQKSDKTSCETSEKQIPREANIIDCPATMVSTGNESVPPVLQEGITETSQKVEAEDCTPGNSIGVHSEAEEVTHGGEKRTDGTEKETNVESTLVDSDKDSLSDLLQRSTKETMQVGKDVTKVREPTASTEEMQTEEAEIIRVKEAKTYEEKDEEEGDEHRKTDLSSDAPVMVEASRDVDVKVAHKKSHNILSGVGSKVKHSISKVKKAITGKSSHHSKPAPPK